MKTKALLMIGMLLSSWAYGCEPCLRELTLEETINAAEVIAVVAYQRSNLDKYNELKLPSDISVEVKSVLKGHISDSRIQVRSYSGMCGYGLVIEPGTYIAFLSGEKPLYSTVFSGCAALPLKTDEHQVEVDGQSVSIEAFKKMYNL